MAKVVAARAASWRRIRWQRKRRICRLLTGNSRGLPLARRDLFAAVTRASRSDSLTIDAIPGVPNLARNPRSYLNV